MNMIVTYDIADERRLAKVARVMKDYGVRVQKSIFEVTISRVVFKEMKSRLEQEMDPAVDGVKYFPVCEKCSGTVEIIGQGLFIDPDKEYDVL